MTAALALAAWTAAAVALGVLIGKAIRAGGAAIDDGDDDPLADQPAEVLAPAHIYDRFTQITGGTP